MTYELASRVRSMQPSATLAITQKAKELTDQGVDVISFGVGQPDFTTPEHIREAAKVAMDEGHTGYTTVRGVNPLLEAIRDESLRRRGVSHDTSEIVASVGAKHTLFNLALALYEPGDEVIVPAPYWVSYPAQVEFVGAIPKVVSTREDDGFRLTPELLKANVASLAALLAPADGAGFADLLADAGEEGMADQLRTAVADAEAAVAPLTTVRADVDGDPPSVQAAYDAVAALATLLENDVATVLALTVPAEAAGDAD